MMSKGSELAFSLRAAAASQRQGRRLDRMASRFGNIAIAATMLLAPLTASLGFILPGRDDRPAAVSQSAPRPPGAVQDPLPERQL